jgi:hypothetical protein
MESCPLDRERRQSVECSRHNDDTGIFKRSA